MALKAVIIRRSDDENTVAIVTAECDPEVVRGIGDLMRAVCNAVTRWAKCGLATETDFTVGDLQGHLADPILLGELVEEGVHSLTVETYTAPWTAWDFDDCVVNNE